MTAKIDVWNMALDKIGESAELESETDNRPAVSVLTRNWDRILREVLEVSPWPWARRQRIISSLDEQSGDLVAGDNVIDSVQIGFSFLESTQVQVFFDDGSGEVELTPVDDYTITEAADGMPATADLAGWTLSTGETLRVVVTTAREGWEHVYALPSDCVTPLALLGEDVRFDLLSVEDRTEFAIVANDGGDGKLLCCDADDDEFTLEYIAFIDYVAMWPAAFVEAVSWRLAAELALSIKKDKALHRVIMREDYQLALDEAFGNAANIGHSTGTVTPSAAARGIGANPLFRRGL